jgi:hypothetical protein
VEAKILDGFTDWYWISRACHGMTHDTALNTIRDEFKSSTKAIEQTHREVNESSQF